ncbi:Transcription elongation factor SPT4 [Phlyctochytrium bullatum]|nr:Transcription elongation factor SPT4 [Phlyctochytrium bullatum]
MDSIPPDNNRRGWRACLLCGLVKTKDQFRRDGCDNCEEILELKGGSNARIQDCTSAQFEGVVALMDPPVSWVARWQRCDKFTKGIYAIRISGRLPDDIIDEMRDRGITYRPRDGSAKD